MALKLPQQHHARLSLPSRGDMALCRGSEEARALSEGEGRAALPPARAERFLRGSRGGVCEEKGRPAAVAREG